MEVFEDGSRAVIVFLKVEVSKEVEEDNGSEESRFQLFIQFLCRFHSFVRSVKNKFFVTF